jgi:hypothetical protein
MLTIAVYCSMLCSLLGDTEPINSLHYSRFLMAFILRALTLSLHEQGALGKQTWMSTFLSLYFLILLWIVYYNY